MPAIHLPTVATLSSPIRPIDQPSRPATTPWVTLASATTPPATFDKPFTESVDPLPCALQPFKTPVEHHKPGEEHFTNALEQHALRDQLFTFSSEQHTPRDQLFMYPLEQHTLADKLLTQR